MVGNGMRVLIRRACPADAPAELQEKVIASYDRIYTEACRRPGIIYPGIPALLQKLRTQGVLTAVISNKPQPQADALKESTFPGMLDAIWGQREGFPLKPDPTLALALLGALPDPPGANVGGNQGAGYPGFLRTLSEKGVDLDAHPARYPPYPPAAAPAPGMAVLLIPPPPASRSHRAQPARLRRAPHAARAAFGFAERGCAPPHPQTFPLPPHKPSQTPPKTFPLPPKIKKS